MTIWQALVVIKNKRECVNRANNGQCNKDCINCDLATDDKEIIEAYDLALEALDDKLMRTGFLYVVDKDKEN